MRFVLISIAFVGLFFGCATSSIRGPLGESPTTSDRDAAYYSRTGDGFSVQFALERSDLEQLVFKVRWTNLSKETVVVDQNLLWATVVPGKKLVSEVAVYPIGSNSGKPAVTQEKIPDTLAAKDPEKMLSDLRNQILTYITLDMIGTSISLASQITQIVVPKKSDPNAECRLQKETALREQKSDENLTPFERMRDQYEYLSKVLFLKKSVAPGSTVEGLIYLPYSLHWAQFTVNVAGSPPPLPMTFSTVE